MNNGEFLEQMAKIEQLLQHVNTLGDEGARSSVVELMQTLMDLHGAALSRIVERLSDSGDAGRNALKKIGEDPLVCGLLVVYGIHPLSLQERVMLAIDKVKPQLQKLGTTVELTGMDENVIRLMLRGARLDAHSSISLRARIEQAVREAAPEVVEVTIDGIPDSGFVPLTMIQPAMKYETGETL
ncbi:MAG TPA: NifU family protein [Candidatus Sulfotelmatobacter sp.]|nr:NifU family protein [Candidatus Sulfotelmatobacter sp.]